MCSLNTRGTTLPIHEPAEAEGRDQHGLPSYGNAHGRAISSAFIKGFKSLGPVLENQRVIES